MVGSSSLAVPVDGGVISVDVDGSGPPLVLLHSLLTDAGAFAQVVHRLEPHLTVYRISLPGFGGSTRLSGSPSIADHAAAVAAAMDRLGLPAEAALLGNGFGSFVATMTAARHPGRVGRLIASNTGIAFPEDRRGAFETMADLVDEGGMGAVVDVAVERIFPAGYLADRPALAAERRAALEAMDPVAFSSACRALAGLDLAPELPRIVAPTLVIAGASDQTTPEFMARELAASVAGARLVVTACGHCPQIEHPGALVDAVAEFLAA
jgi:3-oxoadipate enol-lactonase